MACSSPAPRAAPVAKAPSAPTPAPTPTTDSERAQAEFWESRAERSGMVKLGPEDEHAVPEDERCDRSYLGPAPVWRAFPTRGASIVQLRAEYAPCARVVRVAANAPITISGRATGGAGGYHGTGQRLSASAWGLSFESTRQDETLVVSSANEMRHIHHHYYIGDLVLRVPRGLEVVLIPRELDGNGEPDLGLVPRTPQPLPACAAEALQQKFRGLCAF